MSLSTADKKSSNTSTRQDSGGAGRTILQQRPGAHDHDAVIQLVSNSSSSDGPGFFSDSSMNSPSSLISLIEGGGAQKKLSVGKADDKYEQEADRMADDLVSSPSSSMQPASGEGDSESVQLEIQRQDGEEEMEEEESVQLKSGSGLIQMEEDDEEDGQSVQAKPSGRKKEKAGIEYVTNVNEPKGEAKEELQTKPNAFKRVYRKLRSYLSRSPGSSDNAGSSAPNFESSLKSSTGGGSGLPDDTRGTMESHFGADFSGVRVHTDSGAAGMSEQINAQAFTHGNDIYFNEGKYDPGTSEGSHLLAHELTHTVQQGASVQQKSAKRKIQKKSSAVNARPKVQRSWLGDAWDSVSDAVGDAVDFVAEGLEAGLNWVKDQFTDFVKAIPGYKLLSVVLAQDPISGTPVARNGINFIEAGLDIIPFGSLFKRKLEETGALQEAATWLDNQIAGLDISLTSILAELGVFWNSLSLSDIGNASAVLERAANIIRRPIGQIITFAGNVATEFLRIVKNYVLSELALFVRDRTRGYPLLSVILGSDPITEEPVERNGMNLIRGFMLLSADGEEQLRQMEESGSLQEGADWIDGAVARLDLTWEAIRNIFTEVWNLISIESLMSPIETFQQLMALFGAPVGRIINFIIEVGLKILEFIKKALLSRLSAFARDTRGYPLLTVILGKDPFTEEQVDRNPENIIHGFMSLMDGGEEQFQQMKESGAIQRTTAWIEGAVARLGFTWEYIVGLFIQAWNSFSLQDLTVPLESFARIVRLFADPIIRLVAFVWEVIKKVIEIILIIMKFPIGLVGNIITKAMQAIEDIKRDPIGFLKNILKAIKQGFSNFFDRIGTHLLNGVTGWLFGELEDAGISPPKDLTLGSIFGFVLDVLGLTMERIWKKLGDKIGPEKVEKVRGMIDTLTGIWAFVKDVVKRGPIAIWEYIVEKISNLWDMVLGYVRDWVMTRIIEKIVTKLLSMLDPTGIMAVVNSVIALYSAIESFIRYIREMLEIVNSFVEGVAEVARGSITTAAQFLENSLARAMPVAIGFLANQVGLGGIGRKIGEIIGAVREKVDEGLDWLIDKAVSAGTGFIDMLGLGSGSDTEAPREEGDGWKDEKGEFDDDGHHHEVTFDGTDIKVASRVPRTLETLVEERKAKDPALTEEQKGKLQQAVALRATLFAKTNSYAQERQQAASGAGAASVAPIESDVDEKLETCARLLKEGDLFAGERELPPTNVSYSKEGNKASEVTANPLSKVLGNTQGSTNTGSVDIPGVESTSLPGRTVTPTTPGRSPYWMQTDYVKVHMLSHALHGPAIHWNLAFGTGVANGRMESGPESKADEKLNENEVLSYETKVDYWKNQNLDWKNNFAKSFTVTLKYLKLNEQAWVEDTSKAGKTYGPYSSDVPPDPGTAAPTAAIPRIPTSVDDAHKVAEEMNNNQISWNDIATAFNGDPTISALKSSIWRGPDISKKVRSMRESGSED